MRFPKASYKQLPAFAGRLSSVGSAAGAGVAPFVSVHKETWKKPEPNGGNGI